jgi:hypothetical protein
MDPALLSIQGTVIQAYASLLGIIGMYFVFLNQRKNDQTRDLFTRFKVKADSLIDFINREIGPAYSSQPLIRADSDNPEEVLEALNQFEKDRKSEIPQLAIDEVKKLFTLWAIVQREKDSLIQIKNALAERSTKMIMPRKSLLAFVSFFTFVLIFSFFSMLAVYLDSSMQNPMTEFVIFFAIIGTVPLGNLIYRIK